MKMNQILQNLRKRKSNKESINQENVPTIDMKSPIRGSPIIEHGFQSCKFSVHSFPII